MNRHRRRRHRSLLKFAALTIGTCLQVSCIQSALAIIGATFF